MAKPNENQSYDKWTRRINTIKFDLKGANEQLERYEKDLKNQRVIVENIEKEYAAAIQAGSVAVNQFSRGGLHGADPKNTAEEKNEAAYKAAEANQKSTALSYKRASEQMNYLEKCVQEQKQKKEECEQKLRELEANKTPDEDAATTPAKENAKLATPKKSAAPATPATPAASAKPAAPGIEEGNRASTANTAAAQKETERKRRFEEGIEIADESEAKKAELRTNEAAKKPEEAVATAAPSAAPQTLLQRAKSAAVKAVKAVKQQIPDAGSRVMDDMQAGGKKKAAESTNLADFESGLGAQMAGVGMKVGIAGLELLAGAIADKLKKEPTGHIKLSSASDTVTPQTANAGCQQSVMSVMPKPTAGVSDEDSRLGARKDIAKSGPQNG